MSLLTIPMSYNTVFAHSSNEIKSIGYSNRGLEDKLIDFKEDKEKAKEWGKEKAKEWKLNAAEKTQINKFLDDMDGLKTKYKEINFSKNFDYEKELKELEKINEGLNRANLTNSIVTYKNVDPAMIGFNKSLTNGEQISSETLQKFKVQFLGKDIKFDSYLDTQLNEQNILGKERVILKVTVPSGKSSSPTKAGVILNNGEYKMLIENGYLLHVEKISKTVKKGHEYLQVEGSLKKSLDFKNDSDGKGDSWGKKNYKEWSDFLTAEQRADLNYYGQRGYTEINKYLRDESTGNTNLEEKIKNISEALKKKPISENITVYRYCGMMEFGYQISDPLPSVKDFEEKFLNIIKEEKGYMSTSISSDATPFGTRRIIMRLQVPKGSAGAYVNGLDGFKTSEKEMLLDKGSKYHIDKVTEVIVKGQRKLVVDATLLTK
ncbi:ADP-ribosyltransferase (plasmid) [Bacillus thuringiensis serovar tenebrionis]|uniref:ADP-ribosyltransferase n=2 Tax=Bacillaceae TaxID=186817 RepID=UPI001CBC3668|nr:ADP-ribosyltransferase [Bacillus thuringiensis]WMR16104.1 ADP-ribosyltransferase [Bacillus thuringiensis serovar tenebrionis]WMR22102.1 ADP-ribosyltransferase [Bacillus thuringiensis serovar tenebrionis]